MVSLTFQKFIKFIKFIKFDPSPTTRTAASQ